MYEQSLEIWKKLLGEEHPNVANTLNNVAALYHAQKQYEEAEPLFTQALAMFERTLGINHQTTRIVRGNLKIFKTEKAARESEQGNVGDDEEKDGD